MIYRIIKWLIKMFGYIAILQAQSKLFPISIYETEAPGD